MYPGTLFRVLYPETLFHVVYPGTLFREHYGCNIPGTAFRGKLQCATFPEQRSGIQYSSYIYGD
ncbi:MAG: hypothetical protein IT262_01840 [Saprospiraceae bacterium]|nr:hypothetical protein [Saprospiraceae bacterium]